MKNYANDTIRKDMTETEKRFEDIIIPFLQDHGCKGEWVSSEGMSHLDNDSRLKQMFDLYCGIDWFLINKKKVNGYAVRIQPGGKDWRSFTIRKSRRSGTETEIDKLISARESGSIMPKYHLQCYLDDDKVLAVYIVKTLDLLEYIEDGYAEEKYTYDGTGFYVCDVDGLKEQEYMVLEFRDKD